MKYQIDAINLLPNDREASLLLGIAEKKRELLSDALKAEGIVPEKTEWINNELQRNDELIAQIKKDFPNVKGVYPKGG